jgi:hypothetical protein
MQGETLAFSLFLSVQGKRARRGNGGEIKKGKRGCCAVEAR